MASVMLCLVAGVHSRAAPAPERKVSMTPKHCGKPWKTARRRPQSAVRARRSPIALLAVAFLLCNAAGGVRISASVTAPPDDIRRAAHFLENATFGPSAGDMATLLTVGREPWLDQQFALPESPMPDGLDTNQVRAQLFLNMANGADQLRRTGGLPSEGSTVHGLRVTDRFQLLARFWNESTVGRGPWAPFFSGPFSEA
jgi:hypothetical protein